MKTDASESQLTMLIEIDGDVYAIEFQKHELETINFIVKKSIYKFNKTNRTQDELIEFLGMEGEE